LRDKYGCPDALREAWSDARVDFDSVQVPTQAARQHGRERTFRDPAAEMPVIDYYLFYNDIIPDTIDCFCRAAKEASAFRKVVGAFYCYMFEFQGDPEFGHNALTKPLRSPHLDFTMVTASYTTRELGAGADYARAPITSVALHRKLWYHDNDTVSFRYDEMHRNDKDQATVARYRRELGATATAQETIWQYRRGAGFTLGYGIYQSLFDLHGGYFDDPALMAEVQRLNAVLAESTRYDCSSVAEILVVSDEPSCAYTTFENGFLAQTLQPAQVQLAKVGAPHDSILVDDLALLDTQPYKLVIFLNCFHLTDSQRALIQRRVLNQNRTVVWCYAAGYFSGHRASREGIHELIGIRIEPSEPDKLQLRIELKPAGHPLLTASALAGLKVIGSPHVWGRLFAVRDDAAIPLGTLPGRSDVVLAVKPMPGWTSVYTVSAVLPAAFLRLLARQAGVHIYNDADDTLYASRSYLTIAADQAGPRVVRLPKTSDVFDPFTGQRLWHGITAFEREFHAKATVIWRVADVDPT
jgi:hypothetical protein